MENQLFQDPNDISPYSFRNLENQAIYNNAQEYPYFQTYRYPTYGNNFQNHFINSNYDPNYHIDPRISSPILFEKQPFDRNLYEFSDPFTARNVKRKIIEQIPQQINSPSIQHAMNQYIPRELHLKSPSIIQYNNEYQDKGLLIPKRPIFSNGFQYSRNEFPIHSNPRIEYAPKQISYPLSATSPDFQYFIPEKRNQGILVNSPPTSRQRQVIVDEPFLIHSPPKQIFTEEIIPRETSANKPFETHFVDNFIDKEVFIPNPPLSSFIQEIKNREIEVPVLPRTEFIPRLQPRTIVVQKPPLNQIVQDQVENNVFVPSPAKKGLCKKVILEEPVLINQPAKLACVDETVPREIYLQKKPETRFVNELREKVIEAPGRPAMKMTYEIVDKEVIVQPPPYKDFRQQVVHKSYSIPKPNITKMLANTERRNSVV